MTAWRPGWLLAVAVAGCATDAAMTRQGPVETEGLVRRRDARCGPREEFVMAVASTPVAGRRFSIRAGGVAEGAEVASVITTDEGAFRAALPAGRYCFVDTTAPGAEAGCAAVLVYDPKVESVPIVTLPPVPCPR